MEKPDNTITISHVDGNLKAKTGRNGNVTTYTYNIHGRLLVQTVGSNSVSYLICRVETSILK